MFILANEPFAKALKILETFVSVSNNVCEELASSLKSPTTFDERLLQHHFLFLIQCIKL